MKLFVCNIPYSMTGADLHELFARFGEVESSHVATEKETGRSRGFAFIQFQNDADARRAIEEMDGSEVNGRTITVTESRSRALN